MRTHISLDNTDQIINFYKHYKPQEKKYILKDNSVYEKKWYDFFFLTWNSIVNDHYDNSNLLKKFLDDKVVTHITLEKATEKNIKKVNDLFLDHKELKDLVVQDKLIDKYNNSIGSKLDKNSSFNDFYCAKKYFNQLEIIWDSIKDLPDDNSFKEMYVTKMGSPLTDPIINEILNKFNENRLVDLTKTVQSTNKNVLTAVRLARVDTKLLKIYNDYLSQVPLDSNILQNNIKKYFYSNIGIDITSDNKDKYFKDFDSDRQYIDEVFSPLLEKSFNNQYEEIRLAYTANLKLAQKKGASEEVKKITINLKPNTKEFITEHKESFKYLNIMDDLIEDAIKIKKLQAKDYAIDFTATTSSQFISSLEDSMKDSSKLKSLVGIKSQLSERTKTALNKASALTEELENFQELVSFIETLSSIDENQLRELKTDCQKINNSDHFTTFLRALKDEEAVQFVKTLRSNTSNNPSIKELGSFTNKDFHAINLLQGKLNTLYKDAILQRKTLLESYNALAKVDLKAHSEDKEKEVTQFIDLVKTVRGLKPFKESAAKRLLEEKGVKITKSLKTIHDVELFLLAACKLTGSEHVNIENYDYLNRDVGDILEKYFTPSTKAFIEEKDVKSFEELRVTQTKELKTKITVLEKRMQRNRKDSLIKEMNDKIKNNTNIESILTSYEDDLSSFQLNSITESIETFTKSIQSQMALMNTPKFVGPRFLYTDANKKMILEIKESIDELITDKNEKDTKKELELFAQMKDLEKQIKEYK